MLGTDKIKAFFDGFASAFDIRGASWNAPDYSDGFARDAAALAGDWRHVGDDLRVAMGKVAHK